MLLISIGVQNWYRHIHTPGLKGVLFGVKTGKIKVKYRSEDRTRVAIHGSVSLPEFERNSFVQTFVISVAPLLVSTLLFLFCLDIIFNIETEAWVDVIATIFCVSLFIGSEPSGQDMKVIGKTFRKDPRYSLYQIALVVASGLIVWLFVDLYYIYLPFEVLYYIEYFLFVILVYFLLKIVVSIFVNIFRALNKSKLPSIKLMTRRRRFKMFAPRKLKEKEAQW